MVSKKNDYELWKRFKEGDKEALSSIFLLHYDLLFNYTNRLIHNSEDTKDLIQELFLKLWNSRKQLNDCDAIKYYLMRSIRGLVIDRSRKTSEILREDIIDTDFPPELPFDHIQIQRSDDEKLIEKIHFSISQLSNRQREAIFLRIFEQTEYDEVAKIMDLNVQSVRNLIHAGLQNLKTMLKKE